MIKHFKQAIAAVFAATLMTGAAEAQNWRLNPSYGTQTLYSGFTPDPFYRNGIRGGGDHRWNPSAGCPGGGWFANAPDYRVNYQAGGYDHLTIGVQANGDTMLLVNAPNGQYYCNDDSDGLNPALRFNNPSSGQYDIWVGTYNRSRVYGARIYISEVY